MSNPSLPDLRAQLRNLFNHAEAGQASLQALQNLGLITDPDIQRLADLLQRLTAGQVGTVSCHRILVNGQPVTDWLPGDADPDALEATYTHCLVERAFAAPQTVDTEDTLPVPIHVLQAAANLDLIDHDNPRGADYTTCPACSASETGRHVNGVYQQPSLPHDGDCLRQTAQRLLKEQGIPA